MSRYLLKGLSWLEVGEQGGARGLLPAHSFFTESFSHGNGDSVTAHFFHVWQRTERRAH